MLFGDIETMEPNNIQHFLHLALLVLPFVLLLLFLLTPIVLMIRIIMSYYNSISDMLSVQILESAEDFVLNEEVNQWALEHNFSPTGTFYYKTRKVHMFVSTWICAQNETILSFLFCRQIRNNNRRKHDVVEDTCTELSTRFESDISLSTSNSESSQTLPPHTKEYKESFSGISISELHKKHSDSIAFLNEHNTSKVQTIKKPVNEVLLESMHEDCNHIKSIPFWMIKSVYWHLSRKYVWHNLSIQQQYEKSKTKLP